MTTQLHQAHMLLQHGRAKEALDILLNLTSAATNDLNVGLLIGIAQSQSGDKASAVITYQNLLQKHPNHPAALLNLGADLYSIGRYGESFEILLSAQSLDPSNPMIALNLGNVHKALHQFGEALKSYDQAISLNNAYSQAWSNRGDILCHLGRVIEAIHDFKEAIRLDSTNYEALHNLGLTLIQSRQLQEGLELVNQALTINPNFALAYNSLGLGLVLMERYEEGIAAYRHAISLNPRRPEPYHNLAEAFSVLKQYVQAIECYEIATSHCVESIERSAGLLYAQKKICDWSNYKTLTDEIVRGLNNDYCVLSPFIILSLPSSSSQQNHCASIFSRKTHPIVSKTMQPKACCPQSNKSKIRIGYLSSDFYSHATSYLIAELFELHDRQRFEIILFSYGTGPDDEIRARLIRAVDAFHGVHELSDVQIAEKIRASGIDILVDLKGHTQDARLGPLAHRPAPIQAHYLGYPGTLGTDFIDYLIADHYLILEQDYNNYSEKIIHLPGSYQVNDRQRKISPRVTTRIEHGLPENGFVFCCFNNNWKITPEIFDVWMHLLSKTHSSVLWLLEDNPSAANNLCLEAQSRGIDPARLVFAPKLPLPEHLARHQHADLFLDTPYYNAHTTASDALWAGLPVLTVQGSTFAGRVGGSLLSALNLTEMIAPDLNTYEARALAIAANPNLANDLKARLKSEITTAPLFDTPQFTRNLEAAYEIMFERWRQGLAPDHIRVTQS